MKTIFIVDDIEVNLKVLEVLLTRNGYKTISALSGKNALTQLQKKKPDLILSDIQMPEMDGFQFCRLCKLDQNLKFIPFVFYSSINSETRARKLAQKVGAQGFIAKPADPGMLLKTIENILYKYEAEAGFRQEKGAPKLSRPYNQRLVNKLDAQKARAIYEKSHNQLLKNLPCAVWTIDSKGNIIYISSVVEEITGFPAEHIQEMGKAGCLERVHSSDSQRVRTAYKNLFQSHIALDIEYQFECEDGEFIWVHEKSGIPYKKNGQIFADGISIDLSEKKYSQARGIKSREDQVIKTFARGAARDMNNLFKGIEGYIELSMMDSINSLKREQFLSNALKISRGASELIRDFFTLSSAQKPVKGNISFTDVISNVSRILLHESGMAYKLEIPPDIWPCRVDNKLMAQAVENVIINAREAVEPEGVIEVILENVSVKKNEFYSGRVILPGHYIRARIRDNGRGVDNQKRQLIFHPYYSTKSKDIQNSLGLSLALSEAIITRHGGVITVTSWEENGTSMNIYIPAMKPEKKS